MSEDNEEGVQFGTSNDPVGKLDTKSIQRRNRIAIKEDWLAHLGLKAGDDVVLICREDEIAVRNNDASGLFATLASDVIFSMTATVGEVEGNE